VTKEDRETMIAMEIRSIDTYVESKRSTAKEVVINSGSTRLVLREGLGEPASSGDSVFFKYAGYTFSNGPSAIFDTNLDSLSSKLGVEIRERGFDLGHSKLGSGELIKGLEYGLTGSKVGEYSYILFPSSLGFGNSRAGTIPKMSPLIYEVWVTNIKKQ